MTRTEETIHVPETLAQKIRPIRLVVFDVDGTLTDGRLYFSTQGEIKVFNVQDGAGLKFLAQAGLIVAFLSSRNSPLVERRALELGIGHVIQGAASKGDALDRLQKRLQIRIDETAAMGDDLPDLPLFGRAGLRLAPADAVEEIQAVADWIAPQQGGRGAGRAAAELILKVQGHWDAIVDRFARD